MADLLHFFSISLFPDLSDDWNCPRCGGLRVDRIQRRLIDRLIGMFIPIRRFYCAACGWEGNLIVKRTFGVWLARNGPWLIVSVLIVLLSGYVFVQGRSVPDVSAQHVDAPIASAVPENPQADESKKPDRAVSLKLSRQLNQH